MDCGSNQKVTKHLQWSAKTFYEPSLHWLSCAQPGVLQRAIPISNGGDFIWPRSGATLHLMHLCESIRTQLFLRFHWASVASSDFIHFDLWPIGKVPVSCKREIGMFCPSTWYHFLVLSCVYFLLPPLIDTSRNILQLSYVLHSLVVTFFRRHTPLLVTHVCVLPFLLSDVAESWLIVIALVVSSQTYKSDIVARLFLVKQKKHTEKESWLMQIDVEHNCYNDGNSSLVWLEEGVNDCGKWNTISSRILLIINDSKQRVEIMWIQ